jgi:hypothetical protein
MDFCRRALRCSSMTSKLAMQGELGSWTMQARRDMKLLNWWYKIVNMDNTRIVRITYNVSKHLHSLTKKSNWAAWSKKVLDKYGLKDLWSDEKRIFNLDGKGNNEAKNPQEHQRFWKRFIYKTVNGREEQIWKNGIQSKPKLRTFCLYKKELKLEKYLQTSSDYIGRMLMTTLRTGTCDLEIEKGRWKKLSKEQRLCNSCDAKLVEDERHFIVVCSKYHQKRNQLFERIKEVSNSKWDLGRLDQDTQFLLLINGTGDEYEARMFVIVQRYLIKIFQIRKGKGV